MLHNSFTNFVRRYKKLLFVILALYLRIFYQLISKIGPDWYLREYLRYVEDAFWQQILHTFKLTEAHLSRFYLHPIYCYLN